MDDLLVLSLDSHDRAVLSVPSFVELDCTCNLGKECIVGTASAVFTCMDLRTVLTNDDFTGLYELAAESLDTKALSIGITTVAA